MCFAGHASYTHYCGSLGCTILEDKKSDFSHPITGRGAVVPIDLVVSWRKLTCVCVCVSLGCMYVRIPDTLNAHITVSTNFLERKCAFDGCVHSKKYT